MDGDECTGEAFIGEPCQQASGQGKLVGVVENPAEELDEDDFEEPIGQHSLAASQIVDLSEQQIECWFEGADGVQWEHDHGRERAYEGMGRAAVEVECCAGEVGVLGGCVVEGVFQRAWVEQQARLVDLSLFQPTADASVCHFHLTVSEHVEEASSRLCVEGRHATQRSGMEQAGPHPEPFEQRREPVEGGHG